MKDLNSIIVKGRLTKDPLSNVLQNGDVVTKFSIANNRGKTKNGQELDANFFRIECWGKLAENVYKYLTKGSGVYIDGELRFKKWVDADNTTRYDTYIVAREVDFLYDGRQKQPNQQQEDTQQCFQPGSQSVSDKVKESFGGEELNENDVPF